ncbi:ATP-dependent protease ATP-binding subunit [Janibacter sp. HTCC2649]|uniref:hypothetical protein n=1 Tax=Janibacter sp. HTCC2649 TaxID=313589 RepID=UPI0000670CC6|nr:hypothetical protein [Janibacter sp. HTCC2649]EAP99667.1 ATP-dependent protease ATP-binding subunit [Janibacter sp. HTCC2649]
MSPASQKVLRVLIAVPSVGLALLAAFTGLHGTIVGALVLIVLTPFVVLEPASRLTALLLGLHAVNWLSSTEVPHTTREWILTVVASLALLTIHLAAALASALPPAAPLPRATVARWVGRGLAVVGLSVPVWVLLVVQTSDAPPGVPSLTYAAVASLAVLALAFWLTQADTEATPPAALAPDRNPR